MSLEALRDALPDWARDVRLNIESLSAPQALDPDRHYSTMLAVAVAAKNPFVVREVEEEAQRTLSRDMLLAVYGAASVMAMNNVYYRAKHLLAQAGLRAFQPMKPNLRMQALVPKGDVTKGQVELWCLAASAVNGCGACLSGHARTLQQEGVSNEDVHEALRIAAVISSAAAVLDVAHVAEPARP